MLPTLVHESLHVVLNTTLAYFLGSKLNEAVIVAFTLEIVRHIHARPHLEAWWMARCSELLNAS